MCNDCNSTEKPANNVNRACPKCSIVSNFPGSQCLRCIHVENYVNYLSTSGSLI
jgi:hypothetical protein